MRDLNMGEIPEARGHEKGQTMKEELLHVTSQ